jgi:hypothetical protein
MHFNSQRQEYQANFSIISLVKSLPPPAENAMFLSELNNTIIDETTEADVIQLEEIGIALHAILVANKSKGRSKSSEGMLAQEESLLSLEQADKSVLRRFIHCLATGEKIYKTTQSDS